MRPLTAEKEKTTIVSIRATKSIRDKIDSLKSKSGRSTGDIVRNAIEAYHEQINQSQV